MEQLASLVAAHRRVVLTCCAQLSSGSMLIAAALRGMSSRGGGGVALAEVCASTHKSMHDELYVSTLPTVFFYRDGVLMQTVVGADLAAVHGAYARLLH